MISITKLMIMKQNPMSYSIFLGFSCFVVNRS